MPAGNNFQHAVYSRLDPGERLTFREFQPGAPPESAAWQEAVAVLGRALAEADVRGLCVLQGCPLGTDLFGVQRLDESGGLKRGYSRGIPGVDALLALMREGGNGLPSSLDGLRLPLANTEAGKQLLDRQIEDAANCPDSQLRILEAALNRNAPRPLVCERYLWSSAHHHLGRVTAALDWLGHLRDFCRRQQIGAGQRLLVLALGHAGQLAALASNFLYPGDSPIREQIFRILAGLDDGEGSNQSSRRQELQASLLEGTALGGATLDVVTLGTSIRYGWDPSTLGKLLHIVNHRAIRSDGKRWLAKFELPQLTMEMPLVAGGDYVQQLAVAASDAVPAFAPAKDANRALWELLEPYDGFERWLECARKSVRCPTDGLCLLVDYKDAGPGVPRDHFYGHAAYTRARTTLFTLTEIVRALYTG
jgi:hypothetical protein